MEANELKLQVGFGLENLEKIYQNIQKFSSAHIEQDLKASALSYECLGYYNFDVKQIFLDATDSIKNE
jgi:hypothetical protein